MSNEEMQTDYSKETRHGEVTGQVDKILAQGDHPSNFITATPSYQSCGRAPQLPPEARILEDLGCDACPWLDEYVEFSRKWSPESFDGYHEACGLAVLSTVAAGRVVFDLGGLRKTNLNILLVGRTSVHAKSTASNIAKDLLYEAGLDWLLAPDQITPQKLIADLSSTGLPENFGSLADLDQERAIFRSLTAGQRAWFLDEFGETIAAMMQTDGVMAGIKGLVRTLDAAPSRYEYRTVTRGSNLIINPYLPILGNITIADLAPYTKRGNPLWGDGFLARFVLITPPNDLLSFGRFPNDQRIYPDSLISPLLYWNNQLGFPEYTLAGFEGNQTLEFTPLSPQHLKISDDVFQAYYALHDALRMLICNSQNQDLDGNIARFPEKTLRIAALFASLGNSDTIQINHWAKALGITERWRMGLYEFYDQVMDLNQDTTSRFIKDLSVEEKIIRAIKIKKMVTSREISQFTKLKMDVIVPALRKLVDESRILVINEGAGVKYIIS